MDAVPDQPEYAAELEAEIASGKPFDYPPQEGVRVMKARIAGLLAELQEALKGPMGQNEEYLSGVNRRIGPQIADARLRLASYELLLASKN